MKPAFGFLLSCLVGVMLLGLLGAKIRAQSIPSYVQLFGPVQAEGSLHGPIQIPTWIFPGSALTGSTKFFAFNIGMKKVSFARWVLVWIPRTIDTHARLVAFDYCNSQADCVNLEVIAEFTGVDSPNPIPSAVVITDYMNNLIARGQNKHIGFQLTDNGDEWVIYESRIEMNFLVQ